MASLILALLVPGLLFGWIAWRERTKLLADAEHTAQRTVSVLQEHALKVFETHELLLVEVARRIRGRDWDAIAQDAGLHAYLADLAGRLAHIGSFGLVDADGRIRASSLSVGTGGVSVADRDYFQAHRNGHVGTYVSKRYTEKLSGEEVFSLSIRHAAPDGGFGGVIVVTVPLAYFTAFWEQFAPTVAHVIPLMREDGEMLVRYPATVRTPERLKPDSPFMRAIQRSARNTYTAVSLVDGVERMNAYTRVGDYPLYVSFSIETRAILRQWWDDLVWYALFSAMAAAALLLMAGTFIRHARRERAAALRWQETAGRLQEEMARREQAEETLRQAQKMEAVGQLTGGVAHDFNNLLQAICSNLFLAEQAAGTPRAACFIRAAMDAVERGSKLTQQLLAFARRQPLAPRSTDMVALVLGMGELLQRATGGTVRIQVEGDRRAWPAMIDPNQAEMAVLNLAVNARDAMPEGGTLTIRTACVTIGGGGGDGGSGAPDLTPGDYVQLSVSDTGTGMPPEVLRQAFEPFFTTKEVGRGSGLGLSQVQGFAVQSGGGVRIESSPGSGTTVHVYLPRAAEAAAPEAPFAVPAAAGTARRGTVLLADDEGLVRMATAASLEDLGYTVIEARDGPEALEVLQGGAAVDVLITDYAMPGMRGTELVRIARTLVPTLKVLMITGYADLPEPAPEGWPETILRKPFRPDELVATLDRLQRQESPEHGAGNVVRLCATP